MKDYEASISNEIFAQYVRRRRGFRQWLNGSFPPEVVGAYKEAHWRHFLRDVVERLLTPLLHPTFVWYLIGGVILLGGVPVAIEFFRFKIEMQQYVAATTADPAAVIPRPSKQAILTALHTFYPALAWSSAMQINFADSKEVKKSLRSFAFVVATVALLLSILMTAARVLFTETASLQVGSVGVVLAIFLWWMANAKEQTFRDPDPGQTSQGGSVSVPTSELAGGTIGFKV